MLDQWHNVIPFDRQSISPRASDRIWWMISRFSHTMPKSCTCYGPAIIWPADTPVQPSDCMLGRWSCLSWQTLGRCPQTPLRPDCFLCFSLYISVIMLFSQCVSRQLCTSSKKIPCSFSFYSFGGPVGGIRSNWFHQSLDGNFIYGYQPLCWVGYPQLVK